SCLISAERLVEDWRPQTLDELTEADFQAVFELQPEIVVLGSGPRQRFPEPRLLAAILARGVGCEVMDTGAACRTYNVLVSEARRAVAALFL
ncbi:MAG TPA: Mth938-like domain-containing protein, partial [Steroidobacteraceae bacterium]